MKTHNLKYYLVIWIGLCILFFAQFYLNMQHQKRIEKIFDNYYKNTNENK